MRQTLLFQDLTLLFQMETGQPTSRSWAGLLPESYWAAQTSFLCRWPAQEWHDRFECSKPWVQPLKALSLRESISTACLDALPQYLQMVIMQHVSCICTHITQQCKHTISCISRPFRQHTWSSCLFSMMSSKVAADLQTASSSKAVRLCHSWHGKAACS